jgi:hypothetical protein
MQVEITSSESVTISDSVRRQIDSQVWLALGCFSTVISMVTLAFRDEPAGAGRSRVVCSLRARMKSGDSTVDLSSTCLEPLDGAVSCLARCRRTLERQRDVTAIYRGALRSRSLIGRSN